MAKMAKVVTITWRLAFGHLLAPLIGRDTDELNASVCVLFAGSLESDGLPLAPSSPSGEEAQDQVLGADEGRRLEVISLDGLAVEGGRLFADPDQRSTL